MNKKTLLMKKIEKKLKRNEPISCNEFWAWLKDFTIYTQKELEKRRNNEKRI